MHTARTPVARTPLHHWHTAQGARCADQDGWQVVTGYAALDQEIEATRSGLGLADISSFVKISLRGRGVAGLVQSLVPNSAALKPRGVASISPEPVLACRLSDEHLLLLQTAALKVGDLKTKICNLQCPNPQWLWIEVTSAYAGFWLVGPRLEEVLRRLTHLDVRPVSFPVNTCAETTLAGVEALLVRTAELSVPSLRIYVAWDMAEYVWERMLEAGRDLRIAPLGLEALGQLASVAGSADR